MIRCLVHRVRSPVLSHLEAALGLAEVVPERWVLQARAPPVPVLRPWQPGTPAGFPDVIPSRLVGVVQTSAVDPSSGSSISFLQNFWEMGGHPCSHTCGPQPSTLYGRAATREFWPLVTLGPPGCLRPSVGLGVCGQRILVMAAPGAWATPMPFAKLGPKGFTGGSEVKNPPAMQETQV